MEEQPAETDRLIGSDNVVRHIDSDNEETKEFTSNNSAPMEDYKVCFHFPSVCISESKCDIMLTSVLVLISSVVLLDIENIGKAVVNPLLLYKQAEV